MLTTKKVGIADMKMLRVEGTLVTYALGSCVGICLYDPVIKLASMIHIMLPTAPQGSNANLFKYADTGITETLRKMEAFGAVRRRIYSKIAGGAKMFEIQGDNNFGNIGERNIETVRMKLQENRIIIKSYDVGGTSARTLFFNAENGEAMVKSFGHAEKKL